MFQINLKSGDAIYLQLKEQVVRLALAGALEGGEQLPSVRVLARELGINPNTVSKAYQELEAEGVLYSIAGKGSFLTEDIRASAAVRKDAMEDFSRAAGKAWQVGIRRQELTGILDQVFGKEEGK
ncbi:MAG: GntR family transcriptional regulator [Candidatus Merdivicinus sp.]|jgi:GntR family transcriptional regulator